MDETRRNLMKGMLTGGTLLALGIPGITQAVSINQSLSDKTRNCQLLLGNTRIGEMFSRGAYAACATYTNYRQGILPTVKLEDRLLINPLRVAELLHQSRNTRWIAVMDDSSAAIFNELVRELDGQLLSLGTHTSASSGDATFPLRHVWTNASPAFSAGGLLASGLMQSQHDFSIVENFLEESVGDDAMTGSFISGFSSYRSAGNQATHLHCAGVSPIAACKSVGWKESGKWESVFHRADEFRSYQDEAVSTTALAHPRFDNWEEATGYAIVAMALGMGTNQESCSSRAFVNSLGQRNSNNLELSGKHFVSFVIDV
ncbi:MAG: hypothetical protein DID91_2727704135 [Candidatus Nitrotoga sp. MKT]|nr:MAG: hypothetical protein DID91_2727704135 [Candidatus Nitrotoga sp. MKT]